jgi:hypothetical protein
MPGSAAEAAPKKTKTTGRLGSNTIRQLLLCFPSCKASVTVQFKKRTACLHPSIEIFSLSDPNLSGFDSRLPTNQQQRPLTCRQRLHPRQQNRQLKHASSYSISVQPVCLVRGGWGWGWGWGSIVL